MIYLDVKFLIRAGLGRNEWALHVYYPDNAFGSATVHRFVGTPQEATAAARRKIDMASGTTSEGQKSQIAVEHERRYISVWRPCHISRPTMQWGRWPSRA